VVVVVCVSVSVCVWEGGTVHGIVVVQNLLALCVCKIQEKQTSHFLLVTCVRACVRVCVFLCTQSPILCVPHVKRKLNRSLCRRMIVFPFVGLCQKSDRAARSRLCWNCCGKCSRRSSSSILANKVRRVRLAVALSPSLSLSLSLCLCRSLSLSRSQPTPHKRRSHKSTKPNGAWSS